jgi:hypothetical protein
MAIGHSGGAFASVEAPKVDFGEIALNAQKFNEADIERQEAKKAAVAKAKAESAKDAKEVLLDPTTLVVGTLNKASNDFILKNQEKLNYYYQVEKSGQELTSEQRMDKNQAVQSAKSLKGMQDLFNNAAKEVPGVIQGSSIISDPYIKAWENASKGVGVASIDRTESGDIEVSFFDTKDGKYILGEDGRPKKLTDIDEYGNEVPVKISLNNIASGDFKSKFYKSNDFPTIIGKYAKTVGAYETKIENGTVTEGKKLFTDENISSLNETIRTDLRKDRKYTADILSQIAGDPKNAKKYGLEGDYNRIKKEYTDKEYEAAEKYTSDKVRASLDTGYSRSVDEPTKINIYTGDDKKNEGAIISSTAAIKQYDVKDKSGNVIGKKTDGYFIPFLRANTITTFKGIPTTLGGVGVDRNKNVYVEFSFAGDDSAFSKLSSEDRELLERKKIYLDGPKADAPSFTSIISTVKRLNGKGAKYENPAQMREDIASILRESGLDINKIGGVSNKKTTSSSTIKRSDLASKAAASGYTTKEYEKLLKQKGIKIE